MDRISFLTKAISEKYTDISVEGAGAIKGKNCQIQSIVDIEGGHRVTFAWYNESEVLVSDTLDVMDGVKGDRGERGEKGDPGVKGDTGNGIVSIEKTATQGLVDTYTITMTDGSTAEFTVTNGEGTTVIANPQGEATDDLTKVQIGTNIYDLAGSISCSYNNENLIIS